MRVAFFHGLESPFISDKSIYLESNFEYTYCPKLDYNNDTSIFSRTLEFVKTNNIELLIGSSMGGWLAYCVSLETNLPTVMFNPAFRVEKFENNLYKPSPDICPNHTVILGEFDTVLPATTTKEIIEKYGVGEFTIYDEPIEHRTPIDVFEKYIKKYIIEPIEPKKVFEQRKPLSAINKLND